MTSARDVDVETRIGAGIRGEFPIFESATYLNSCSQGALSHRVRDAVEEWLSGWDANGAEWDFWVERNETFRSAIARVLHAEADDVAVTTSVSQGVSALVSALPLDGERNRIVISEYEFPTVGQIAHAQELRGAEVVHVLPGSDGEISAERFAEAIDERTALVCCTTLSYRSGHRHDVGAIAEAAHAAGAIVLADSYQACGAVELDVRSLGADVVTGGTVKYLLGTAGLGFMWLRPEVRQSLVPTQTGWFADEDIFAMSIADYSPHRSARRFDSGTPPVPALYAGVAGLSLVEEAGVQAIEAHVRGLVNRLLDGLETLGATVPTPRDPSRRGPLVCVRSTDVTALVEALAAERIVVSSREDKLRVALHLYNVDEDVDRLLEALSRTRALLA
jgi:selenocysteine lyase/cysteine desulfurase